MTNQELFESAVAGNWIAESFDRDNVADGIGVFKLSGSSKGYSTFADCLSDGQVVFYAAFDDDCNREAGYGTYDAGAQTITPIESTATLANGVYIDGDVTPIPFPNGGTITGTFNAVAFNALWEHIWDKENPHEVIAEQVDQDDANGLGDTVQDALNNIAEIVGTDTTKPENYVGDLPPAEPIVGDEWTDIGVTGEQYVWEGDYWVSITGGGVSPDVVRDRVDDPGLYNQQLCRVIDSETGEGEWVISSGGEDSGNEAATVWTDNGGWLSVTNEPSHGYSITWSYSDSDNYLWCYEVDGYEVGMELGWISEFGAETVEIGYPASALSARQEKYRARRAEKGIPMPANVSAETPLVVHGNVQANDVVDADGNSLLSGGGDGTTSWNDLTDKPSTFPPANAVMLTGDQSVAGHKTWTSVATFGDTVTMRGTLNGDDTANFQNAVTAGSFVKSGGTSSQYLMADGTVSSGVASHNHDDRYYQKTETKKVVVMTEAEYNALGSKDANTVYMLT